MSTEHILAIVSIALSAIVVILLIAVLMLLRAHRRDISRLAAQQSEAARAASVERREMVAAGQGGQLLAGHRQHGIAQAAGGAALDVPPVAFARIAVVMNPSKHDDPEQFRERARRAAERIDARLDLHFYDTTVEDPGYGQALEAIEDGSDLVIAAGGDGTVRMVASALAHAEARMGIIPAGTGNLLARNLEIPLDNVEKALRTAVEGVDKPIDVGWMRTGLTARDLEVSDPQIFLVIAGVGADAEVIGATDSGMKKRIGWIAYVLAGLNKIAGHAFQARLTLPGQAPKTVAARTVLIGNVGKLPAGIVLMPDAAIDNAQLELMVLSWRGPAGLGQILTKIVNPRARTHPKLSTMERGLTTAVEVITSKPQPIQLDGDTAEKATHIRAEVDPGAITMRVGAQRAEKQK
ncbi:sphingosine kinase [Brachybacterium sp. JHP9]|uniref:Sphingosine kinase n=1 Tax=Brachybacterium equifaecis TaxID=2910770 RepID=A0ABT0QYE8_9MICO|nr:diacylglycerol kinase family protein [Brachybacterium equifaecis]MCL6422544.1 sphingosine kinase [Brachybacterium equifaecis]